MTGAGFEQKGAEETKREVNTCVRRAELRELLFKGKQMGLDRGQVRTGFRPVRGLNRRARRKRRGR